MKIYTAGFIQGNKIEQCSGWRKKIRKYIEELDIGIVVLDPLNKKDFSSITDDGLKSSTPPHAIVHRDRMSIKASDLIIANMDRFGEQRTNVGTICELAWAFQLGKPIIMITDEKQYIEHPFLSYFASAIFPTIDKMLESDIIDYFIGGITNAVY